MRRILKTVELRNEYTVYAEDGAYLITSENRRGQLYETRIPHEAVAYLCDMRAGQRISAERAGADLRPVAERFDLPYTYGDRLRFSGQYVLIAAVAADRATVVKEGRTYMYSIKG